ncbi:MAG: TlpA disulfide reductase family protein [Spirochaetales bacterium]
MGIRKRLFIAAFAVLLIGSAQWAAAASIKPWYAPKLEKLGFYVFDPPFVFQDFKVINLAGAEKARANAKGKIVLLNFWATWCPPCKEEIPSIEALSQAMKGKNFEVFAVNLGDDSATVKSFVAEHKLSFPIYLDPKNLLSGTYASQGIPTTYLLDKDGRFIAGMVGAYNYSNPDFMSLLDELSKK